MFYRKVYPKAWQLLKQNPVLWFFGMFASLLGFYEIRILFNLSSNFPDFISTNIESWIKIFVTFSSSKLTFSDMPDVLTVFGIFVLFSAVTILAVASQGALTYAATSRTTKLKESRIGENLKLGVEKFWPLFGLNIINSLIGYFFMSIVVSPLIYFLSNTSDWPVYILLSIFTFFILIPLIVVISFVTRYGTAFVVIKNQRFSEAFVSSWTLFKVNWMITIENAIVLLGVSFVYLLLMVSAVVLVLVSSMILAAVFSFFSFIILVIGIFLSGLIIVLATSMFGAFYNIVWANTFLDLVAPGKSYAKVHRVAHKHMPKMTK